MTYRIRILAAIVAALATLVSTPAFAADAQIENAPAQSDQRPCVSWSEFRSLRHSMSKVDVEARWEVTGLGVRVTDPGFFFGDFVAYPKCGYEKGFPSLYYYGVQYVNHGKNWKFEIWDH